MIVQSRNCIYNYNPIIYNCCKKYIYIKNINLKKKTIYKKYKNFIKIKKPYFYIFKTKNFTLSFTKDLIVRNGFVYMLLENIVFLNYMINKCHFQTFVNFIQLKKDIMQVSNKSNKKNGAILFIIGIIKVVLKPYKPTLYDYAFKMMFIILFFPKNKKMFSKINLKILKLHPPYLNLECLLFLQNITEMGAIFRKKNIKILTVNNMLYITPLFNGFIGALKDDTLYLIGSIFSIKNPNLAKFITSLKNILKKNRNSNDIGFEKIKIISQIIPDNSYFLSNYFIINDALEIILINEVNQRNILSKTNIRLLSTIQFLIEEELIPKVYTYRYTPIPYFN
uniref:Uncharacterized protein n=1 Tax=Lotharella vacuolata TaxID=74820 RepID=A0A0H5BHL7_9EUKA|nr:hypothetical protein [Lotharella vacuolata]BAS01633.1 hypothetical protein [Lotharella vacuolata]